MEAGVVVPVLVVVVRPRSGVEEEAVSGRRVLQMVVLLLRLGVGLRVQRIRAQHRGAPRLPHRIENLLLVRPPDHRHLLHRHVYLHIVHPYNTITEAMSSVDGEWFGGDGSLSVPFSFERAFRILFSHPEQSMCTHISTIYLSVHTYCSVEEEVVVQPMEGQQLPQLTLNSVQDESDLSDNIHHRYPASKSQPSSNPPGF
ncbi:hypothetical protein BHE74_00026167 [Ensete ventricosum]|nr:hypothetical protein BHE74_00026167 [Ensete ventricosum]